MGLEFLTYGVALPLYRLAKGGVDARKGGELFIYGSDQGIGFVEIAGLTRAEGGVAVRVGYGGGAAARFYPLDQSVAFLSRQESAFDE